MLVLTKINSVIDNLLTRAGTFPLPDIELFK